MNPLHAQLAAKATELLSDGEWHPYERVLRQLMKAVPPGIGLRKSEEDRIRLLKKRGVEDAGRTQPRDLQDQIWTGQRAVVRDFLRSNARVFETDRPGKNQPGGNHNRHIRMVELPRAVKGDHYRQERDRLAAHNEELIQQVRFLRAYLNNIGHSSVADALAPLPEGEEEAEMENFG